VIGSLNLNNDGWAFAPIGLWLAMVNGLAWRGGHWPKPLAAIGLIFGIGHVLTIAGFALGSADLILISAGLGAIILGPIWFIGLGVRLRRADT
jgi:hypothetical protein